MREYMLADRGYVWIKRDYSQQEMRILAHFTEGRLYRRYRKNPRIDAHDETRKLIKKHAHIVLERKPVKTTGFGIVYGMGVPGLAHSLGVTGGEAVNTREAYFTALPEVKELMDDCQQRGFMKLPILTWGGREYFTEPAKIIKGRMRSFEYKLLNYLIQGSGADCTKEATIRWHADAGNGQFLASLHDELDGQAPEETWQRDMKKMRLAMENIEFDVLMLSDGFVGPSWAELEACK
jgi:DNA polymerase-1